MRPGQLHLNIVLETGNRGDPTLSIVHHSHTAISNEETLLQDLQIILKQMLQNYLEILKKCL